MSPTPDTITEETESIEVDSSRSTNRRGFFAMGGVAAAAAFFAACGDDDDDSDAAPSTTEAPDEETTTSTTEASGGGDADIAAFAAGLELLAANTYQAALDAATAGDLGEVPPAVAEFATTAQSQHQAASDALAEAAGGITPEVPADIESVVNDGFAGVSDIPGLAMFAREFENQAASTYLDVIPKLESEAAISLAGSILPITRQRIAILDFVLGEYPVPETFASPEGSLAPS